MQNSLIQQVGVVGWVLVTVVGLLVWIIKMVMTNNVKREKLYNDLINNHMSQSILVLNSLVKDVKNYEDGNSEAHRRQREEHTKQIESLIKLGVILESIDRRMNGNSKK